MEYFSQKTWIPASLVASVIIVAITTTAWLVNAINNIEKFNTAKWLEIENQLSIQNNAIKALNDNLEDKWTIALHSEFALRLQNANPTIVVPDPRELTRSLKK